MSNRVKFILKRIVYSFITIVVLIGFTFTLMHMLPGDPFSGGKAIPEATKAGVIEIIVPIKPVLFNFLFT